ncbi:MAG: CYTH domain-containing protein [Paludibacteraceae bacterium]|nr:CYTH domain-containing protein [Paludibacteraceae bacterium]
MIEIERKFLVDKSKWVAPNKGCYFQQGYLAQDGCTLRVRIAQDKAYLTIKGKTIGFSRAEFEYPIPVEDAQELMKLSLYPPIEKIRYCVEVGGKIWEVDEFLGAHKGLVLAEIELQSEDETFEMPIWAAQEVTGDARYYNSSLSKQIKSNVSAR